MTEQLDIQGEGESPAPIIERGDVVLNKEIFREIREFVYERYTENDAVLAEATLVLCGLGEYLKKELNLQFEVNVE